MTTYDDIKRTYRNFVTYQERTGELDNMNIELGVALSKVDMALKFDDRLLELVKLEPSWLPWTTADVIKILKHYKYTNEVSIDIVFSIIYPDNNIVSDTDKELIFYTKLYILRLNNYLKDLTCFRDAPIALEPDSSRTV
jgi:hypothetical protein